MRACQTIALISLGLAIASCSADPRSAVADQSAVGFASSTEPMSVTTARRC